MVAEQIRRGDVFLVTLSPTVGTEIRKTRPCVVVSPDELNLRLPTVIVAPLTTGTHLYPFRIPCTFKGRPGHVVTEQLRSIDRARLVRPLGSLPSATLRRVLVALQQMFGE